ncbi:MAG: hypothetical protein IIY32_06660, partial [Thermoguttaceae bacterium]|nr:hypothetical protein [Thermoguttaceae bacterium]
MNENYKPLLSYSKEELTDLFKTLGLPAFRAGQVRRWVFSRKTDRFSQMSDLSKDLRAKLTELFARPKSGAEPAKLIANGSETVAAETFDYDDSLYESRVVAKSVSDDGSEKLLLEWRDGRRVECVLLRDDRNHRTACVSVQVGCAMGCVFCCSGMGGFVRNLTRSEILEELLRLNALLPQDERLTHIVVMG